MVSSEPGRVKIKDVAKHANVSISTVSRVVNELDRVNPETRERVLEVIRELRYQPSAFARGLAIQRTQTLGFVIPILSDPFFLEIVRGVEEAAAAAGHNLLVASQPFEHDARRYLQLFDQRRVDSMILVGIKVPPEELERLLAQGFAVAFVQQDGGEGALTFLADNYGGARVLAEHLLELGYRRIAYIAGSDYTPDNAERLRGLKDALAGRGLAPFAFAQGDYHRGSGSRAMAELIARGPLPEAVFAANDQMAIDAVITIREQGLRVPEDIAVVGFDDVPMAGYVSPALTTVRQPAYEMGYRAASAVLDPEKPLAPKRVVLPTQVVVRQSCGNHLR
ncbi:MAG: LacI family transcriptional regulator [Deinococcota bacterium]|jgi:LacI family transcriptional regulator|nr:LacI family transcriptional regulator [Deinococcota bacterium]